jgi:hypothetical protein
LVKGAHGEMCKPELELESKLEIVEPTPTETRSKCLDGHQRTDDGEKCELKDVQCDCRMIKNPAN